MSKHICRILVIAILCLLISTTITPQVFAESAAPTAINDSEYTVTVPATLKPGETGEITLSGNWPSTKMVTINADDVVNMICDLDSSKVVIDIKFDTINQWGNDEINVAISQDIQVDNINVLFGDWSGIINYDVQIGTPAPGLYGEGNSFIPWDDLIADGIISVNGTTITKSNRDDAIGKLVVPESITTIGESSFYHNKQLTGIVLPNTVTSIAASAFAESGLHKITIPASVTSIVYTALQRCQSMTDIYVDSDNPSFSSIDGVLYNKTGNVLINLPSGKTSYTLPKNVTGIHSGSSIYDTPHITSFAVAEGHTKYIEVDGAIYTKDLKQIVAYPGGKTGLAAVIDDCEVISHGTFAHAKANALYLPSTVKSINAYNIFSTSSIQNIYYAGSPQQWTGIAIDSDGNGGIKTIPIEYNYGQPGLHKPDGTFISWENMKLQNLVSVNNGVYTWTDNSIEGELIIGDDVTIIEGHSMQGCTGLTNIVIGKNVTRINDANAFYGCTSLMSITIPASVEYISTNAFDECTNLIHLHIDKDNPSYTFENGVLYNKEKTVLMRCLPFAKITEFVIPDSVINIADNAFEYCKNITSIQLSNSVEYIGIYAFRDCSNLQTINITHNVQTLSHGAFENCTSLTEVIIPNSVTTIGHVVFGGSNNIKRIVFEDGCTLVADNMFMGAIPETIILPASITYIDIGAFQNCTSNTNIYYGGTEEQWKNLCSKDWWNQEWWQNATMHYEYTS